MFGLDDLMKKVDLGDILEKVGLSDSEKKEVTNQAADAIKYRTTKEKARGNEGIMANLFSSNDNTAEADNVAKKLEGDLAYNLKNIWISLLTIKKRLKTRFYSFGSMPGTNSQHLNN